MLSYNFSDSASQAMHPPSRGLFINVRPLTKFYTFLKSGIEYKKVVI